MIINYEELIGREYNKLTIIGSIVVSRSRGERQERYLVCRCDCGNMINTPYNKLKSGHTKSCGCYGKNRLGLESITHGERHNRIMTKEYRAWTNMKTRCRIGKTYVAKGIKVSPEWHDFTVFLADMGRSPASHYTVERIDNSRGYEKGNCKWATRQEQATNKDNNVKVTYQGNTRCLAEWGKILGIGKCNLQYVYRKGRIQKYLSERL